MDDSTDRTDEDRQSRWGHFHNLSNESDEEQAIGVEYFRDIVTVLFTVVVAFSIRTYNDTLFNSPNPLTQPYVALVGAYSAILFSWIGYHFWIIKYPYETRDAVGQFRLVIDLAIVMSYAYLLYTIQWIIAPQKAPEFFWGLVQSTGTVWYLWVFVVIFLLYIVNDFLVWENHQAGAGHICLSIVALGLYLLTFVLIWHPRGLTSGFIVVGPYWQDWITILSAAGVMILWRVGIGIGKDR